MFKKVTFFAFLFLTQLAFSFQDSPEMILRKLTGDVPISGNTSINERFTQNSRELSAEYLLAQTSQFIEEIKIDKYSTTGMNVVASIPSTEGSDEWVVLGAHYDSVEGCPGANDNASGTALVYAVARHIASLKTRKYNTYIVFFDEEERGLVGSRAFARQLKESGVKVHSAHTIDQMGWDEDGDKGIELEMPDEALLKHYRATAKAHGFEFPIHTTKVTSTDHRSFRELGFPAIGLTEEYKNRDTTPHYHKSTDTFDTINLDYLNSSIDYMKAVFADLLSK